MAQAKRRKPAKSSPKRRSSHNTKAAFQAFKQGFGFFASGVIAGGLGLLLWQGYQSQDPNDLGSGIRSMVEDSRMEASKLAQQAPAAPVIVDKTPRAKGVYSFYTVLPEFEEVLPKDAPPPQPVAAVVHKSSAPDRKKSSDRKAVLPETKKAGGSYMLQVASFSRQQEADGLKASLTLKGMRASVQKVSIDSKKYYRVRVGPYSEFKGMEKDDSRLTRMGYKAMRLKITKAG